MKEIVNKLILEVSRLQKYQMKLLNVGNKK